MRYSMPRGLYCVSRAATRQCSKMIGEFIEYIAESVQEACEEFGKRKKKEVNRIDLERNLHAVPKLYIANDLWR